MTSTNDRFGTYPAAKADGSEFASKASAMAGAAGDQVAEVAAQAQQVAKAQLDNLADAIRRKPLQATGIAAGVGFMLAMLARR